MADPNKWLGLMRWSMKYQDGTAPSNVREMTKEDRDFLDKVLKEGVMDENERVRQILRILDGEHPSVVFAREGETVNAEIEEAKVSEEELAEYKDALLDELLVRIDQIDNAMNMVKSQGFDTLMRVLENYERASTRALAAEVCSVVVQNNPFCQDAAVKAGLLEVLCKLARDDDVTCQVKALLAISCLVRQHKVAEKRFLSDACDGLRVLEAFLQADRDIRLKRKSLFFLRYLVRSSISTAQQLLNSGSFVPAVVSYVEEEDVDLCESALQALAEFAQHDVYFATACKRPEYGLEEKLEARIAKIEQLEGEDREYAAETLNLAKELQRVLEF
jgi:hsp70-interacting protein